MGRRVLSLALKIGFVLTIGIPFVAIGLFMCITIVLIPIGIPLIFVGAFPLYWLLHVTPKDVLRSWAEDAVKPEEGTSETPWYDQ
jgi:hypothetical protein